MVNPAYSDIFGKVIELRKMLEDKKLDKVKDRDIYNNREYVRRFVSEVSRVIKEPLPDSPEDKMEQAKQILETAKEVKKAKTPKKGKKA